MHDQPSTKDLEKELARLEQENADLRRSLDQYRKNAETRHSMQAAAFRRMGDMVHDFNNILGIILGNTEMALKDLPAWDPSRDWLAEIKTATLRATRMVKEIPGPGEPAAEARPKTEEDVGFEKNSSAKMPSAKKESGSILFVDDESAIVRLGKQMLASYGYTVTGEVDPGSALEVFRQNPDAFDLVITDLIMPGMSGADLTAELIKIRPDIPVIVSSGNRDLIDSGITDQKGINAFMAKPIRMIDLFNKVRDVLRGSPGHSSR